MSGWAYVVLCIFVFIIGACFGYDVKSESVTIQIKHGALFHNDQLYRVTPYDHAR